MALSTLELTDYISGKVYLFKGDFSVVVPPNVITGATNLGTGTTIFTSAVNNNLQFRSLKVLGGLTISNDGSYVYLSGSSGSTGGGTITGATNGLSVTGKDIQLGGILTGNTCVNLNNFGIAFGCGSIATGPNSFAEGKNTCAIGNYSHAENVLNLAFGYESHAEGYRTCACGTGAHTEGHFTCAFGFTSHAEGNSTVASGNTSHSEGITTKTIGNYSHAEGFHTCTIGNASHVEGSFNISCGNASHSEGVFTRAIGCASHVGGVGFGSQYIYACGQSAFNHSQNDSLQTIGFGANADNSVILGGLNHNICSGNTRAVIIGGCGINLTGTIYTDYTMVPNLAIWNTPSAGSTDDVLTWNSTTKKVEKITQSSITGSTVNKSAFNYYTGTTVPNTYLSKSNFNTYSGTTVPATYYNKTQINAYTGTTAPNTYISGATNGLTKTADHKIKLGGTLTENTNISTANFGIAFGCSVISTGKNSFAGGISSCATGCSSFAFGCCIKACSNFSFAVGYGNCTKGTFAHAEGRYTAACGYASHTEGNSTIACGNNTHAEGNSSISRCNDSHSEGNSTCSVGCSTHSEGKRTNAIGNFSHSQGYYTTACGCGSHTGGLGTSVKYIFACGRISFNHSENTTGTTIGFGANAANSAILGGVNHNICSGNTRSTIIGGCGINLTGSTYADYTIIPNLGIWNTPGSGGTDDILTWNSNTKKINKVTQSSVSGSTANLITKTVFSTYTGTTAPATYLSKTNFTTYSGTTEPATYLKKTDFTTYSGTTEPATYLKKTDFTTYSGTTAPATYASKASAITGATNLGTGTTIYTSVSANKIQLKSFKVSGLGISNDSNYITLSGVSNSSTADQTVTITNSNYTSGLTLNSNARIINIILDSTLTNDWAPSVISNVRQFGYYEFFITKNASVNITLSPLSRVYFEDSVDPFLDLQDVEVGQMAIISARGLVRGIQFGRMIITDNKYNPPVFTNIFTTIFNQ